MTNAHVLIPRAAVLLDRWAEAMERWWTPTPDGHGVFGFGLNHWGMQSAWRYASASAVLADRGGPRAAHWRARSLACLRHLLQAHHSGAGTLLDGQRWGRTWISCLALERSGHALRLLESQGDPADRAALDRVFADEAVWLCDGYERGSHGLKSTRWANEGGNHGESHLWNGCLLWRVAERLPTHPRAADWRERAHGFLLNAVSVAADLTDDRIVAGKPLRERVLGAGFFDHFAFDHHGYLNVGYQVIAVSQAAMLHFDAKRDGFATPESLHHHQRDLWDLVRRTVFGDGRLARIGGDSRVRYAYCQEYLVPSALYAADHLGDGHALELVDGWLATAEREAEWTGDGTFYGKRLDYLVQNSPSYWLRVESDRACALSMLISYLPATVPSPATGDAEASLAGGWGEPEHGAVLHRSPQRLAAFAWRAYGLAQGTCQPPGDGNLAEWSGNLMGKVDFIDLDPKQERRALIAHDQAGFAGGFVTWGRLALGCGCRVVEGWDAAKTGQAVHHLAFAALPDDRTVLAIEVVRVGALHAQVKAARALHLNLPNDCFNGMERRLETAHGALTLHAAEADGVTALDSRWAQLAPGLACIGLTGGSTLSIDRSRIRRGGAYRSLHVEEIGWGAWSGLRHAKPGEVLLDASWLVRCGGDAADAARCAELNPAAALPTGPDVRAVRVVLPDGRRFVLALNLADVPSEIPGIAGTLLGGAGRLAGDILEVPAFGCALVAL